MSWLLVLLFWLIVTVVAVRVQNLLERTMRRRQQDAALIARQRAQGLPWSFYSLDGDNV